MKTYFRDFTDISTALRFAERRSNLGHNVRVMTDPETFRVYFSSARLDLVAAVVAEERR